MKDERRSERIVVAGPNTSSTLRCPPVCPCLARASQVTCYRARSHAIEPGHMLQLSHLCSQLLSPCPALPFQPSFQTIQTPFSPLQQLQLQTTTSPSTPRSTVLSFRWALIFSSHLCVSVDSSYRCYSQNHNKTTSLCNNSPKMIGLTPGSQKGILSHPRTRFHFCLLS